jgi:hypothetical protein
MKAVMIQTDSHLAPWERTHKGLTWRDMGGTDEFMQKVNFSLFRRGLYDPSVDVVTGEAAEALLREVPEGRMATTGGVLVKKSRPRNGYGAGRPGVVRHDRRGEAAPKTVEWRVIEARKESLKQLRRDLLAWLAVPGNTMHQLTEQAGHEGTLRKIQAGKLPCVQRLPEDFEQRVRTGMKEAVRLEKKRAAAERDRRALQAWCQRALSDLMKRRPELTVTGLARLAAVSATALLEVRRGHRQLQMATLLRIQRCFVRHYANDLPRVTLGMERRAA